MSGTRLRLRLTSSETRDLADRALAVSRRRLQIDFDRPRDVSHVDLLPYSDSRGVPDRISVNGHAFAVHPGWNRLQLGL